MGTLIRRISLVTVCILLVCSILIGIVLFATDRGRTWAQEFNNNPKASQTSTVEIPLYTVTGMVYHTEEHIEHHILYARKHFDNSIRWSCECLQNIPEESVIERTPEVQQKSEENQVPQSAIEEHVLRASENLTNHMQWSKEQLENWLAVH